MLNLLLMSTRVHMELLNLIDMIAPGVDGYEAFGMSEPRLDNGALICPLGPKKIVKCAKDNHRTSYQRAIVHVDRCR